MTLNDTGYKKKKKIAILIEEENTNLSQTVHKVEIKLTVRNAVKAQRIKMADRGKSTTF